ncbi:MAG: lysozyme [Polyangiaceae bacterium]|nr:lysozyme [Polyangiaceae bacterium]
MPSHAQSKNRTLGMDVSHYQKDIDWPAVYATGVRFVFCKAAEGTHHVDPLFDAHLEAAQANSILPGSYHFFRAHKDPEQQAQRYFDAAAHRSALPPVLDFETLNGVSATEAIVRARRFIEATEALWDRACIVYTYPAFWNLLGQPEAPDMGERPLWIAHYTTHEPILPRPWKEWTFWQYDGTGGQVLPNGMDADFNWFNGSEVDLHDFQRSTMPTLELTR